MTTATVSRYKSYPSRPRGPLQIIANGRTLSVSRQFRSGQIRSYLDSILNVKLSKRSEGLLYTRIGSLLSGTALLVIFVYAVQSRHRLWWQVSLRRDNHSLPYSAHFWCSVFFLRCSNASQPDWTSRSPDKRRYTADILHSMGVVPPLLRKTLKQSCLWSGYGVRGNEIYAWVAGARRGAVCDYYPAGFSSDKEEGNQCCDNHGYSYSTVD